MKKAKFQSFIENIGFLVFRHINIINNTKFNGLLKGL